VPQVLQEFRKLEARAGFRGTVERLLRYVPPGAAISPAGLLLVLAGTAASSYTVTVQTVGAPVATAAAAVTVDASIPITGVVVSPARSVMDSAQQEQLAALVLSQNGEPNANQAVFWNLSGPSPAFISASGVFTSPAMPGIYSVTATSAAAQVSGTATIDVGENLMITPSDSQPRSYEEGVERLCRTHWRSLGLVCIS
jgi:hypothetical protein